MILHGPICFKNRANPLYHADYYELETALQKYLDIFPNDNVALCVRLMQSGFDNHNGKEFILCYANAIFSWLNSGHVSLYEPMDTLFKFCKFFKKELTQPNTPTDYFVPLNSLLDNFIDLIEKKTDRPIETYQPFNMLLESLQNNLNDINDHHNNKLYHMAKKLLFVLKLIRDNNHTDQKEMLRCIMRGLFSYTLAVEFAEDILPLFVRDFDNHKHKIINLNGDNIREMHAMLQLAKQKQSLYHLQTFKQKLYHYIYADLVSNTGASGAIQYLKWWHLGFSNSKLNSLLNVLKKHDVELAFSPVNFTFSFPRLEVPHDCDCYEMIDMLCQDQRRQHQFTQYLKPDEQSNFTKAKQYLHLGVS